MHHTHMCGATNTYTLVVIPALHMVLPCISNYKQMMTLVVAFPVQVWCVQCIQTIYKQTGSHYNCCCCRNIDPVPQVLVLLAWIHTSSETQTWYCRELTVAWNVRSSTYHTRQCTRSTEQRCAFTTGSASHKEKRKKHTLWISHLHSTDLDPHFSQSVHLHTKSNFMHNQPWTCGHKCGDACFRSQLHIK